ncbi:PWWP domain-containing protein [Lachnellula hyalina]|uniref:PWWP domain-containing protein n=1 Tax=Lachnellula hyalina TaxID=1316788 RepID=A0A8H8QZN7_9HELO|nr:PWWP domain-containing protein [Lachnellula hyalina]TVY25011.1 PWWP domain-containing protein [Lachnellula hyalina]
MSEDNISAAPLPEVTTPEPRPETDILPDVKDTAGANDSDVVASAPEPEKEVAPEVSAEVADAPATDTTNSDQASDKLIEDKAVAISQDTEMKDTIVDNEAASAPVSASESAELAVATPASSSKAKAPRRKSGVPEHKGKKLNRKASRVKMTHTDAKPGDYFFVRLKGFPLWPAIVCDETMLPEPLLKSRPVTAARADGTYREDYEDGGPKEKDRTFAMMYLHTNEFGWIPNYDLLDLNPDEVATSVAPSTRKDLVAAHQLAAEQHDLDYFKQILKNFVEARAAEAAAKEAFRAAKAAKKSTPKKAKVIVDVDGDVDMEDATGEPENEELDVAGSVKPAKPTKSKKRKSDDDAERTDSVKKPKTTIKLNTPKANGTATPKSTKDSAVKSTKPKTKKSAAKVAASPEAVMPKEPELTPEEKQIKKEASCICLKEILFLRHKLQKGLLTRDQEPKEEEMKQMSEFVTKLEGYADLEVSIIRATKINKVLKAILKINTIPKEDEFQFKPRSTALLDKWNKLLASEQSTPAGGASANGIGSEAKPSAEDAKPSSTEPTNGVKEATEEPRVDAKIDEQPAPAETSASEAKEEPKTVDAAASPVEEPSKVCEIL